MSIEKNRQNIGPRVLDGIKVIDFSAFISGPYCTRLLADLGADVLKVEPPAGELLRVAPPIRDNNTSALFSHLNAGKRCLSLDLKNPQAQSAIKRLVADYDVVIENFSPGVMQRLGLDYEALKLANPKLIMCSISGFGQSGPGANRPAFAPVVQAWSGYEDAMLNAQPTLERPLNMGPPVADTTASLQAFGAITAALFYRERSGIGQYIDIAMYDALISTVHKDFQQMQYPLDSERYYGPLRTQDGWIVIMLLGDRHFTDACRIIGREDLIDDPRFNTTPARLENYAELIAIVEQWTETKLTDEADSLFGAKNIPASAYRDLSATIDDPQLHHRQMITEIVDGGGPLKITNSPFLFSETHAAVRPWVADIGQHNGAVLGEELGLDEAAVAALSA